MATEGGGGLDIISLAEGGSLNRAAGFYLRHNLSITLSPDQKTVFLADPYENGLLAIDVGDRTSPKLLGVLAERADDLSSCGSTVVAAYEAQVTLVDASEPSSPTVLSTATIGEGENLAFSDDCSTAFQAAGGTLRVFDFSNPNEPRHRATFEVPGKQAGVAPFPDGHTVIVAADDTSTCAGIIDVAGPNLKLTATEKGLRHYRLTWKDRFAKHPEHIAFRAEVGEVRFTEVDHGASTATLSWKVPDDAPSTTTLVIAVGNHQYYEIARAGITDR